jgi:hypothetical protein
LIDNQKIKVSICIPIYKPDHIFFEVLEELTNHSENIETLVIFETIDELSQKSNEAKINKIIENKILHFEFKTILKPNFHHSKTRNLMIENIKSPYVLFTTQDTSLGNVDLGSLLKKMDLAKADALTVRHIPRRHAFSRVWEIMFTNVANDAITNSQVGWWSNNFSIYKTKNLYELPFPEFEFAEDFYWAQLAQGIGLKLVFSMDYYVIHHNQDNYQNAKNRAIQESRASYSSARVFGKKVRKINLTKSLLSIILQTSIVEFKAGSILKSLKELRLYFSFFSHQYWRIRNWNKLVKGEGN